MPNDPLLTQLSEYEEGPRFIHLEPEIENVVEVLSRPVSEGTQHPTIFEVLVRTPKEEGKWSVSSKRLAHDLVKHLGTDPAKWVGVKLSISFQGSGFDRTWTVRRLGK